MRQPHKMIKHTQTVRRLLPTNCLSVLDHFVMLALKGLIWCSVSVRSYCSQVFHKKDVSEDFARFTAKHLCQSLFLNKVTGSQYCNFTKKNCIAGIFL